MTEDVTVYVVLATVLAVILGLLAFLKRGGGNDDEAPRERERPVGEPARRAGPNRVVANRNARARMRAAAARRRDESDEEDQVMEEEMDEEELDFALPEGKIGKRKMAKLQAKAEKRAMREAEERERKEKKERDEMKEEERKKREEIRAQEEAKRQEQEEKEREERERKEHEEYLLMKQQFEVQEEGFDENQDEDKEKNLLAEFITFVKDEKVVVLEEVAARFSLKTQDVINRLQTFLEDGTLSGVIDDRGKFIYISVEELEAVAKFIRQRGRVSVAELAESSNKLINMAGVARPEECPS